MHELQRIWYTYRLESFLAITLGRGERGEGGGAYFRGGGYFRDSPASVENVAYFREALTFETLRYLKNET